MFIIFWRRWGIIGAAFLLAGFLVSFGLAKAFQPLFGGSPTSHWPWVFGLIFGFSIGALANWLFAVRVVEPKLDRPGSNPPVASSTIYFMPLRYWSFVILAIGVVFIVPNVNAALTR